MRVVGELIQFCLYKLSQRSSFSHFAMNMLPFCRAFLVGLLTVVVGFYYFEFLLLFLLACWTRRDILMKVGLLLFVLRRLETA